MVCASRFVSHLNSCKVLVKQRNQLSPTLVEYLIRNRQAAAATRLITPIRSSSPTLVMSSIGISIWPALSDQVRPDTPSIAHKKKAIIIPAMLKPYTLLEMEKIQSGRRTNCKKAFSKVSLLQKLEERQCFTESNIE